MITSFQRRANDRRRFLHGYDSWVERRAQGDGCVAHLVRGEVEATGHARQFYRVDVKYQRRSRHYWGSRGVKR